MKYSLATLVQYRRCWRRRHINGRGAWLNLISYGIVTRFGNASIEEAPSLECRRLMEAGEMR
ncbi:uncharacterized protein DS421_16g555790 [Arachis hypogaea]|nr:uncharacterized protein DS421_16g555790 [Arachis hypogaea]